MSRMMGYFTNTLAKLNRYIERENKKGADIPRFTKGQIRLIVRYLEAKELFLFPHAIDCGGGPHCHCDEKRKAEFRQLLHAVNRKIPSAMLETII
jgi:hypothetical protein